MTVGDTNYLIREHLSQQSKTMNTYKHILLATEDPGVGGVAQYNHSLLCALASLGCRVTSLQPPAFNENLIIKEKELGIQHLFISNEIIQSLPQLFTEESRKPDLLICSNVNPFSNFNTKKIAIDKGIPYIIIENLVEPHLAEEYSVYLNELSYQYTKASSVVAVSGENLQLLHQLFELPQNKGEVIYYGRPSQYFCPQDLSIRQSLRQQFNISPDGVVCFTAARIETRKGYQYQIEAIKQLLHSQVWSKLYFVWAGAGIFKPQLEAEFKEIVKQLNISDKVIFLGQVSNVSDWLNAADIFVFPSQLEGMPLCVMEAMAKGLPVIASAVSGIPEELGDTGKLLSDPKVNPQATVQELVVAIEEWANNSNLREYAGQACKQRAEKMFTEERMITETVKLIKNALLPHGDYVSPGLEIIQPDEHFPYMIVGDTNTCGWSYLRREIPHNWYVDQREPVVGFLSRDEAHILYNTALQFKGKKALEIGCWLGWSACHIALAGVELDVVDPLLAQADFFESVSSSLKSAGVLNSVNLVGGYSPEKVEELAVQLNRKWSLIFIDGNHDAPAPLNDAILCEKLAEDDAIILFHDLTSPDVAQGLDYFKQQGWNTIIYQTMQIMGVAWRGNVQPVQHQPDPTVYWHLPNHLQHYSVSGLLQSSLVEEFVELLNAVRPYTLLSEERLFSLYSLAKQICSQDIPGNFVECGSYKGGAAALLASVIKRYSKRPRLLYAFDTFEGMPEPTQFDSHKGIPANDTGFGVGTLKAPIEENLKFICQSLQVEDIVRPVQGLFAQTLPEYKLEINDIALLHADGDWYESTIDIFNTLYDDVISNGYIQVDDYGHWEGCKRAIHEFEEQINEKFVLHEIDYTGVWFQKSASIRNSIQKRLSPTILIDGVFFQLSQTGIARVWKSLLEEWSNTTFAQHIIVLDRVETAPKISGIRYRTVPAYDYNNADTDREILQLICEEEGADLFISSYYTTPTTTPSVFMAYDMIPEVMGWDMRNPMWQEKHRTIQEASSYIAISQNTAQDLAKYFPNISVKSITVAHCGVHSVFSPAKSEQVNAFKSKYGITKPYFIAVGAGTGYKNSILFFRAFAQLASKQGFDIICTGTGGFLETEFRQYTFGCNVHMLQLSDEELALAYSGAVALVYPSKYEGFGMPIVEAMACGCPVITCPKGSILEVAGEAVIYVNDDDIHGLANALCEVQKPGIRQSLITAGIERAKQFSWSNMAQIVSSKLIETTVLALNLKEINLIIFPDWLQSEETLIFELENVIGKLATHPQSQYMTLVIDISNSEDNYAELLLSAVSMNLLMESDLDISEGLEISLLPNLSKKQWQTLLPRIQGRVVLEYENKQALVHLDVLNIKLLPTFESGSLNDISFF
jgi:glycosyltransferase involved in cell wall biosynthesis/predicted O-methyltransferase YrrM